MLYRTLKFLPLVHVAESTKWVNQMDVAQKSNEKWRICVDSQALNTALMREH